MAMAPTVCPELETTINLFPSYSNRSTLFIIVCWFRATRPICFLRPVQRYPHYPALPFVLLHSPYSLTLTDCAVCEDGFTSGFNFECKECPKRKSPTTVLLAGVALLVTLSSAVLLSYLRRVVGDGESAEVVNRQGFWKGKISSLHKIIDEGGPSSALKTTVVVWQIISQVCRNSA